jgi:hypothetical protein
MLRCQTAPDTTWSWGWGPWGGMWVMCTWVGGCSDTVQYGVHIYVRG